MDKNNIINNVFIVISLGLEVFRKLMKKQEKKIVVLPLKMLGIGLLKMSKERNN